MTLIDAMDEVLQGFAVDAGDPQRRRARAQALLAESVTAEQVETLGRYFEGITEDECSAIRMLCACLYDPAKRTAKLQDLQKAAAARQERRQAPYPGQGQWQSPDTADAARQARIAFCRVVADRKPEAEVATEMGLPVSRVRELVEQGRAIQSARDAAPPPPTTRESEQQRQSRIREALSEAGRLKMKQRKGESLVERFDAARKTRAPLLEAMRRADGKLDLRQVRLGRAEWGALAELEADGLIEPMAEGIGFQVVEGGPAAHAAAKARRQMANEHDLRRPRSGATGKQQPQEQPA